MKMVYPFNGMSFCNKYEWNVDTYYNKDEPQKHFPQ